MGGRSRTSIRTTSATTSELFLERMRALRDDPTCILPTYEAGTIPVLDKLAKRLEGMKGGKTGLLTRFDRGVIGVVAGSFAYADRESQTHLLDAKVGDQRRYYLPIGHLLKPTCLGVQNHDDPLTLLLAYGEIAPEEGLWFFAGSKLWCTGKTPAPPQEWFEDLAEATGIQFQATVETPPAALSSTPVHAQAPGGLWSCGHAGDRLLLRFAGGPALAACTTCLRDARIWPHLASRVLGPDPLHPAKPVVQRSDGGAVPLDEKLETAYTRGLVPEAQLVAQALEAWRGGHAKAGAGATASGGPGSARWVLGSRDFGADHQAFLAELNPKAWERDALASATRGGHVGAETTVSEILLVHAEHLPAAVAQILGAGTADADAFIARHGHAAPSELLRQAAEEAERRHAVAALPAVTCSGPLAQWLDAWARHAVSHPRADAIERLRREVRKPTVGKAHLYALNLALGGDASVEFHFDADQREAGRSLAAPMAAVLAARGATYVEALRDYAAASGSGESVEAA